MKSKTIILLATLAWCATLFWLPVEYTHKSLTYPYPEYRTFSHDSAFQLDAKESVRWDILLLWWGAIAVVGGGLYSVIGRKP